MTNAKDSHTTEEGAAPEGDVHEEGHAAAPSGGKKAAMAALQSMKALNPGTGFKAFFAVLRDVLGGLGSEDAPTRRMALFFVVSMLGIGSVFYFGTLRYQALQDWKEKARLEAERDRKHLGDVLSRQAENANRKGSVTSLGNFTFSLQRQPHERVSRSSFNMAEMEIVLLCDSAPTCKYVEENLSLVRDQIFSLFAVLDREELLSRDGKSRMKKVILDKLNSWLPSGRVDDLFIPRLVIG